MIEWLETLTLRIANAFVALVMFTMFALIFGNVVARFVFHSGIAVSEEFARLGFLWITFVGAALALRENAHIGVAGIRLLMPAPWRWIVGLAAHLIMAGLVLVMLYGTVAMMRAGSGGRLPISGLWIGYSYAGMVAGGLGLLAILVARIIRIIRLRSTIA